MSFLNSNTSEFLSARITQRGRNSIAQGNFNISYFQVGDSEFDYTVPFNSLSGTSASQHVFAPLDKEAGVKYPFKLDSTTGTTTYGIPVLNSTTTPIRNVIGPAGFVSEHEAFGTDDTDNPTGTTIQCPTNGVNYSAISGNTSLIVTSGTSFQNCEYITLVLSTFAGTDYPVITGKSNSFIYKLVSISGNTLNLDRSVPDLSSLSGMAQVVCNKCEIEHPLETQVSPVCLPNAVNLESQHNPWTMNVVWGDKVIGDGGSSTDENLSGYTSNQYVSTKSLLGYTSDSGQTFTNVVGTELTYPTSYYNSFNERILVEPSQQRTIAIIHYSENGDILSDPERFFKYDDYISNKTGTTLSDISIVTNRSGVSISDTDYFEVYIPFIYYHRNTGTTLGAIFKMDTTNYYVKSTINGNHQLLFRYLKDEQGNFVGKVFVNNKVVVFDDQELVAILDYKSNRKHTLAAPKVSSIPTDTVAATSILSGSTGQTLWVTYALMDSNTSSTLNNLPCNYYSSIQGTDGTPSNVTVKFSGSTFQYMNSTLLGLKTGFIAKKFKILAQLTATGTNPSASSWKVMDFTSSLTMSGSYINPTSLTGTTFVITKTLYDAASTFDLETYMGTDYLLSEPSTGPQFGDTQPFPGSVRLVRATDIEEMNFLVNLPSSQFTTSQNPTYSTGNPKISEVALLNDNKETLVIAKTSTPITRSGTQVFAIKLDF